MATKNSSAEPEFMGYQLLKLPKYDNRIARIVIKFDEYYSMAKADALIEEYKKRKED